MSLNDRDHRGQEAALGWSIDQRTCPAVKKANDGSVVFETTYYANPSGDGISISSYNARSLAAHEIRDALDEAKWAIEEVINCSRG